VTTQLDRFRVEVINLASQLRGKGLGANVVATVLAHQDDPPQVFGSAVVDELTDGANPVRAVARFAARSIWRFTVRQCVRVAILLGLDGLVRVTGVSLLSPGFRHVVCLVVQTVGGTVRPSAQSFTLSAPASSGLASALFYAGAASRAEWVLRWVPRILRRSELFVASVASDTPALELLAGGVGAHAAIADLRARATAADLVMWQVAIELVYSAGDGLTALVTANPADRRRLAQRRGLPLQCMRAVTRVLLCGAFAFGAPRALRLVGCEPPDCTAYWASCAALVFVRQTK
jgi:hypothetical protein